MKNRSTPSTKLAAGLLLAILLAPGAASAAGDNLPFYPCQTAGADPEATKQAGITLAEEKCAALTLMNKIAGQVPENTFQNAAGLCRITYLEGIKHLSNACGAEALIASHVRYLGDLLKQPVGPKRIELLARSEQVGLESEIQMNTVRKVTGNLLAFHHALNTNLATEGTSKVAEFCRRLPLFQDRVAEAANVPGVELSQAPIGNKLRVAKKMIEALSHCQDALAEISAAQAVNANLSSVFEVGALRHQVSIARARTIQDEVGQIGFLMTGKSPLTKKVPEFQKELLKMAQQNPELKTNPVAWQKLVRDPGFLKKAADSAIDRMAADVVATAEKEVSDYAADAGQRAEDAVALFEKSSGLKIEQAVNLLPKTSDDKDVETFAQLEKNEILRELRTDYVNDLIAETLGTSKLGIVGTVAGQGLLEAIHDHVIERDPLTSRSFIFGMAKNATALAGPIYGAIGDGTVDFIDTGNWKQGVAAMTAGLSWDGAKWVLATYAPIANDAIDSTQPYIVGVYYAFKAADYGVFRLGQAEIERGVPKAFKLDESNYDYIQQLYEGESIELDPRRSYVDIWKRTYAIFRQAKAR